MNEPRAKPRQGRSFRLVGGIFAATIALGIAFAVIVYVTMIRYEPVALAHVPAGTTSAVRVDLEKVVLYEPFRKHLLPLVDELRQHRDGDATGAPRLRRIQRATKIDLALDLREIAIARGATSRDWVLIVGGKFPKRGVVAGMAEVLREEGLDPRPAPDGQSLSLAGGAAFGQAADGALILASNAELLARALPVQETWRQLGLDDRPAASFSLAGELVAPLARHPAAIGVPALRELGRVERITGAVALAEPLRGEARVALAAGSDSSAAADRARATLSGLAALVRLTGSDIAGEARVLETVEVTPVGPAALALAFQWRRQDLDRGAESLGQAIRRTLGP